MKVLIQRLAARLQRLSPFAITAIGLCTVLAFGVLDYYTPRSLSLTLIYVLIVAFVGWYAGRWPAAFIAGAVIITAAMAQWILPRNIPHPAWVVWWNSVTRLLAYSFAGWVTAEVAGLNRNLKRSVEERTAQWKAEAEGHKATASRLSETLERFQQVVNNISEVFWLTDVAKNQMAYISPGYERIWGRKCEELYREPRSWAAAVHPADRDEVFRRAQTDQAAGNYDVEYRIVRPDGAVRWIRDRAFPVRNQQGEVYRVAGIADDITERKQAREVLQTQAAILENMAEGVVVTDEEGMIVQMNPASERIWGYERNEVIGQPVSVLSALPEPASTEAMREVLEALQAARSWCGTFKNRRKDGAIMICQAVVSRVEVQGRVLLVAVEQDVTERLRDQQQLQMQARVLESMAEAALMVDEAGTIVLTNPALDGLVGYETGELGGQPMQVLAGVSPEAHNRILKETVEEVKTRGAAKGEYLARRKDGSLIEVETRSSGLSLGGRFCLVVVGQDITERKQAESALARQEALYRTLFELSPDGILLEDLNGGILDANRALCQSVGYTREELLEQGVRCLVPPECQGEVEAHLGALRAGQKLEHEVWNLRKNGQRCLMRLNEKPLTLPDGRQGVLVVARDVTHSKRVELTKEAFLALGSKLSTARTPAEAAKAIYAGADQLWQWDCGALSLYSPELDWMQPMLFYDVVEGQRREVPPAHPPGPPTARTRRIMREGAELILRKEGEMQATDSVRIGDTTRLSASIMSVPMRREGHPVGVLSIQSYTRDAYAEEDLRTLQALADYCGGALERIRAAQALQQREELNRTILATAMDGYYILDFAADPLGAFVEANEAYCRITGYTREELLTMRITDLESPAKVARHAEKTRAEGGDRFETRHRRKNGQEVHLEISVSLLPGQAGSTFSFARDITQRKQAERALAQREQLYRTLFELSPDGILLEDTEGQILDANRALCQTFGYSRDDLVGRNVRCLVPPDNHAEVEAHLATLRTGQTLAHELWNRRKNGERCLMWLNEKPLTLPDGRQGVLVVARDVTRSKRVELTKEAFLALGSNLSAARTPAEAARAVYAAADQLWRWDAATLDLYGAEQERMEPLLFCDIIDGQRREVAPAQPAGAPTPRMRRIMQQGAELILRTEADMQNTDSVRFGNTSRASASIMCVPMHREDQPIGVLSIQSYTPNAYTQEDLRALQALADHCGGALERVRTERALHESEELNRTILATAMDGFYALDFAADPGGAITEVNEAFCRLTGYSREELLQMRITDLETIESPEEVARHKDRIMATGADRFETRHRRKNGQEIYVEISLSKLASGRQQVFGFVRDITERKRAELAKEAFLSLGAKLSAVRAPLEAARAIYASADLLWNWDSATLDLYSPESGRLQTVLNCDVVDGQRREVPPVHLEGTPSPRMLRVMRDGAQLILGEQPTQQTDFVVFGDTSRHSASMMYVPLRRAGQAVGVLSIQSYTPNAFTGEDLRNLQALADHCSGALERLHAEAAQRETDELLRAFYDSPGALRGVVELLEDDLLVLSANVAQAAAYGRTVEGMRNVRATELGVARPVIDLWVEKLRQSQKDDAPVTFEYASDFRAPGTWGMTTASPLKMAGGDRPRFAYLALDITERKRAELIKETLLSLGAKLSGTRSPVEAARVVFTSADRLWKWDAATLDLHCPERDWMEPVLFYDVVEGQRRELTPVPPAGGPPGRSGRIMREGPELILRQPADMEGTEFVRFGDTSRLSASLMYVALRREGQPVGVLSLQSYTPNAYTQDDLRTLQALADHCAGALDRIRAETALREAHDKLEQRVQERTAELQAANSALAANEARLELALDASNAGTWSWEVASSQSAWDERYHALYGFEPHEPVSFEAWIGRVHPEDRERLRARIQTLLEPGSGDIWNEEFRAPHPVKGERWMASLGRIERDPSGRTVRFAGINLDITERKALDRALREAYDTLEVRVGERTAELQAANAALSQSEERYRSLVTNLSVGVYRSQAGLQGGFLHANPALARMLGYDSVEELLKVKVADTYQDPRERGAFLRQLQREGTLLTCELRLKRRDGTPIYASVNATAHHHPNGEVDWIDGVIEDITQRKQGEQALRVSEERYRALAESSPDAIFILDRAIKVQYANSAAAALWGRAPEEVIGLAQPELFPAEVARYHCKVVAEVFATGKPMRRDEPLAFPSSEHWIEIRLVPLFGEQGKVTSVMGVCRDITERKRAEGQLAEALDLNQKMIAASAMGIAAYKASGECVFANEALARTVGGRVREVLQGNFRRLKSWQKSGLLQLAKEALSERQARRGEFYTTTRFGKSVWLDCHVAGFVSNGEPHLLLLVLDITERKRSESLLQAQRDLGVSLSMGSDLRAALQRLLEIAMQVGGLDSGGVFLVNQTTGGMDLAAHRGASARFVKAVSHWAPDSPEMRLARRGRPVFKVYRNLPIPHDERRRREGLRASAFVPLLVERNTIGMLTLASRAADEIPRQTQLVIEAIATQAAGAIARIQAETERHRLQRQILEISDREQARIGQDIHDGLCQQLVSLAFDANSLQRELSGQHRPEASQARRIADWLDQSITEARQLSRGLFPVRLETEGLPPALEELARATSDRFKIRCSFDSDRPVLVKDSSIATHLYRIAQEAVANAIRHSRARSLWIRLRKHAGELELTVEDNGAGLSSAKPRKATGMGLHIMEYRARTIGGRLQVGPGRRGGTIVSCCIPAAAAKQSRL